MFILVFIRTSVCYNCLDPEIYQVCRISILNLQLTTVTSAVVYYVGKEKKSVISFNKCLVYVMFCNSAFPNYSELSGYLQILGEIWNFILV